MTRGVFPRPHPELDASLREGSRVWAAQYANRPGTESYTVEEKPMELWYLAHPISGDDQYNEYQNMEHALVVQVLLWEAGLKTVNTWYSFASHYGSAREDPERLEEFLNLDKAVIKALGGIVLVGHKMSSGMEAEFLFAQANKFRIANLIGIPNRIIAEATKDYLVMPVSSTLSRNFVQK